MRAPTLSQAREACRDLCSRAGVELVEPGDLRREGAVAALALVHAISGSGWDYAVFRGRVSLALPGAGEGAELLAAVPYVGPALSALLAGCKRPMVLPAPDAWSGPPWDLLGIVQHELGHIGDVRRGGLLGCVGYAVLDVLRGAREGGCYVVDLAHRALSGGDPAALARGIVAGLDGYSLGHGPAALVYEQLQIALAGIRAGEDPSGGTVAETLAALRRAGWEP